jgi:hypothetical protein
VNTNLTGYRTSKNLWQLLRVLDIDSIREGIVILSDKILSILPSPNVKMRRIQSLIMLSRDLSGDSGDVRRKQ